MKKLLLSLVLVIVLASSAFAALPSVTMLSTTTCPACAQMEKVLKQVNSQYAKKITTAHIFLEENPDIAKKYNVRYVPTLIFRDAQGNEIAQKVGFMSLNELVNVFKSAGVKI